MDQLTKLYSQKSIGIATFFGGPLAAGFLIRKNYINLNKEREGLSALIIGIISTLVLLIGVFLIPENIISKIPNSIFPFIYTTIIYFIVEKIQGDAIKSHESNNGEFYSGWRAAGIGATVMIVLGGVAFISADLLYPSNFDANKYDQGISEFTKNENKALQIYTDTNTKNDNQLISELNEGIKLWRKNKVILKELNNIKNLPSEFKAQNKILLEYCDLRIDHYLLIRKSIKEGTTEYDQKILHLGNEIDSKLGEL